MTRVKLPKTRSKTLKTVSKTISKPSGSKDQKKTLPSSIKKESNDASTSTPPKSTPRRSDRSTKATSSTRRGSDSSSNEDEEKVEIASSQGSDSDLTLPIDDKRTSPCEENPSNVRTRRSSAQQTPLSSKSVAGSSSKASPQQRNSKSKEWEVEAIREKQYCGMEKKLMYSIKWVGYPEEQNTWEPKSNLTNCQELLEEFHLEWIKGNEIEKILEKCYKGGVLKYHIKWVGWGDVYNTWEPDEHLTKFQEVVDEFNKKWRKEKAKKLTVAGPGRGYTKKVLGVQKKKAKYNSDGDDEEEKVQSDSD